MNAPIPTPITRLLIANRGEIAVRIARSAHQLGIGTVGVYSEPDANALHVDVVDQAVALGGSTAADSYLRGEAIIAAAQQSGCDAVHPGYGFLAENADFAQAVIDAGLIWVGPTPEQIALLGDKVAAKAAAVEAGVPTTAVIAAAPGAVPGDVPMPALVKAAAGGGGRGMRIVRVPSDLGAAVEAAAREAQAAFGDGTVFIEPYVENGRHIEVQIMGDQHGNVVHFGVRECSIQRRNQKVLEEAPSVGITAAMESRLTTAALALASHVGYQNAGTVEFLVGDGDGDSITFLEVNTRLQVEHPATELATGCDLVELQLQVASGLTFSDAMVAQNVPTHRHAIEVRVVAEDPAAGWMPSTGVISEFHLPVTLTDPHGSGVRVDTGFRSGAEVTPYYDSLLAKVISVAPTRAQAAAQLRRALQQSRITGVATNLNALIAILGESDFLNANTLTSYLDTHQDLLAAAGPEGEDRIAHLAALVMTADEAARTEAPVLGFAPSGWRNLRTTGQRHTWVLGEQARSLELPVELVRCGAEHAMLHVGPFPAPTEDGTLSADDRTAVSVRLLHAADDAVAVEVDGVRHRVSVQLTSAGDPNDAAAVHAVTSGPAGSLSWTRPPRFVEHAAEQMGSGPICPLPGTVIAVHVEPGQTVTDGEVLMVVEAMKMEHQITAVGSATVAEVRFGVGDRVDTGDLLVALDAPDGGATAVEKPA